jgi:acyl dehydratase
MDRVRFVKPVFIGDTIHLEGEVIGLDDKDDKRGVLTVQQEIKNQRGETCVALQKRLLMKKRAYDA